MPSLIREIVYLLPNKMAALTVQMKNVKMYRECSLKCFSEMWLTDSIPEANVELTGFSIVRVDRVKKAYGNEHSLTHVVSRHKVVCSRSC